MSLTNFSLPFGALAQPAQAWGATIAPLHPVHQLAASTNSLLYSPADHQPRDDDGPPPSPGSDFYKNNPYAPPQLHQQQQFPYSNNRRKSGNTYLPPLAPPATRNTQQQQQQQLTGAYHHHQQQQQQQQQQQYSHRSSQQQYSGSGSGNSVAYKSQGAAASVASSSSSSRTYGEGSYSRFPAAPPQSVSQSQQQQQQDQQQQQQQQQQHQYYNAFNSKTRTAASATFAAQQTISQQQPAQTSQSPGSYNNKNKVEPPSSVYGAAGSGGVETATVGGSGNDGFPHRPPGFTRVQAGQGSRTQVHAVLDYDADEGEEDYYDESDQGQAVNPDGSKKSPMPTVTPIQGPIFLKNGTVPVVPLFSYPTINNGSFVQIPIWWTALSVALGLDVRGDIIKGVPCIKRYHQLFCPTAGNSYPIDKIERFIDDNKALMRRMYGDFEMNMDAGGPRQQTKKRRRRFIDEPDIFVPPGVFPAVIPPDDVEGPHHVEQGESYFGKLRERRQAAGQSRGAGGGGASGKGPSFGKANSGPNNPGSATGSSTGRLDACESKIEIVTPYWASNSAGKIRAIVNTQHFEQAIHQEICSKAQTPRCEGECGCEQKYKWHRLLAYDPDNDCKGIFMDWFLFPSCCVCRCNP